MLKPQLNRYILLAAMVLMLAIQTTDLLLPLGVAVGMPYVAPVLLGWWLDKKHHVVLIAMLATVLITVGWVYSPAGGIPWVVAANRGLAYLLVWIAALLVILAQGREHSLVSAYAELHRETKQREQAERELRLNNTQLEQQIQERSTALQESEKRFKSTFDHSPSAILLKDLEGRFQLINRRYEEWFGVSAQSTLGKTSADVYPQGYADALLVQDQEVIRSGEIVEHDHEIPSAKGDMLTLAIVKFPVRNTEGEIIGVGTIATDVSVQKKTEAQLREAQKMEAVGQLAGGIAHDFNNLLQIITGYAELAEESLSSEQALSGYLKKILQASNRASSLTQQLLTFSRRQVIRRVAIDCNEVIIHLIQMLGRIIGEDIELTFTQGSNLRPISADRGMIEQVILNLCVNARDAMPDGGQLQIETRNILVDSAFCAAHGGGQPGDYVIISLVDSGHGMEPNTLERIFEPFFTTKEVGQGTGLGLAMAHGIVEQHGGWIEVSSERGVSSAFTLYFPATEAAAVVPAAPDRVDISGGEETILIAEDEAGVRDLLASMLEGKGYRVLTAIDGQQAVEMIEIHGEALDLVILDVVMPKMKGREVYERIREKFPNLAILFSTGYSGNILDEAFLKQNQLMLIQKPYSPTQLYNIVREVLDGQTERKKGLA